MPTDALDDLAQSFRASAPHDDLDQLANDMKAGLPSGVPSGAKFLRNPDGSATWWDKQGEHKTAVTGPPLDLGSEAEDEGAPSPQPPQGEPAVAPPSMPQAPGLPHGYDPRTGRVSQPQILAQEPPARPAMISSQIGRVTPEQAQAMTQGEPSLAGALEQLAEPVNVGPMSIPAGVLTGPAKILRAAPKLVDPLEALAADMGRTQLAGEGHPQPGSPALTPELSRQGAAATHELVSGALETAAPAMLGSAVLAPVETAITIGAAMAGQAGVEKGLTALGLPKEYAAVAGDLAGLIAGAGALKGAEYLKTRAYIRNILQERLNAQYRTDQAAERMARQPDAPLVEAPVPPAPPRQLPEHIEEGEFEDLPPTRPTPESYRKLPPPGPLPKMGAQDLLRVKGVDVEPPADAEWWQQQPETRPEIEERYRQLFDQAEQHAAHSRTNAAPPQIPRTGIPEEVARAVDARDRLARTLMNQPFSELGNSARIAIDGLVAEGWGSAVQPPQSAEQGGNAPTPATGGHGVSKGAQPVSMVPTPPETAPKNALESPTAHPPWSGAQGSGHLEPGEIAKAPAEAVTPPEKREYSSSQVNLPPTVADAVRAHAALVPDDQLAADGREDQPHITVKYGLHGSDPAEVAAVLKDQPPIIATIGKTSLFHTDDADVLKADVDSPDLHALNAKVADALPHTDTHPEYKPHVTIAYLKKGEGTPYAGQDVPGLTGQQVTFDRVTFSSKDGNETEIPLNGAEAPAQQEQGSLSEASQTGRDRQQTVAETPRSAPAGLEAPPSAPTPRANPKSVYGNEATGGPQSEEGDRTILDQVREEQENRWTRMRDLNADIVGQKDSQTGRRFTPKQVEKLKGVRASLQQQYTDTWGELGNGYGADTADQMRATIEKPAAPAHELPAPATNLGVRGAPKSAGPTPPATSAQVPLSTEGTIDVSGTRVAERQTPPPDSGAPSLTVAPQDAGVKRAAPPEEIPETARRQIEVQPSAEAFDEIHRQLQALDQNPALSPGEKHNVRVELERELEHHRPAAEVRAQSEIDRQNGKPSAIQPLPANVEPTFAARLRDNLAEARKRNHVDVDEGTVKKTMLDLTRQLSTEDAAAAKIGTRDGIIHRKTEWKRVGKKQEKAVKYLAIVTDERQGPLQNEFEQPDQAIYWLTDHLYSLGVPRGDWHRYGNGRVAERLGKGQSALAPAESGTAAAEAAAKAIGRPDLLGDIYHHAFSGGWKGAGAETSFAEVAQQYAESLPRNETVLTEGRGSRSSYDVNADPAHQLTLDEEPRKPQYGNSWESKLEDYERAAKGLAENLKTVRRQIDTARQLSGGTTPRIEESAQIFDKIAANIRKNLDFVKQQAKAENVKEIAELEPKVRAAAEAYAKYGEAAFADKPVPGTKDPDMDLRRYAKLRGLEAAPLKPGGGAHQSGAMWTTAMKALGVQEQPKPARIPLPGGKDKLTKGETEAMQQIALSDAATVPGNMDVAQRFQKRGWADDKYNLTEKGKAAVYSYRMGREEAAAGMPMAQYAPKNRPLPGMGESRLGNEATAWNKIGGEVWHTNGHGAWKGEFPGNWAKRDVNKPGPDIARALPKAKGEAVKPVGFNTFTNKFGKEQTNVFFDDGTAMARDYFDYTNKRYGAVKWTRENNRNGAFQAWDKDGKRVAVVMPMRVGEPPANLKQYLKGEKVAAGKAADAAAEQGSKDRAELFVLKDSLKAREQYENSTPRESWASGARLPVSMTKEQVAARIAEQNKLRKPEPLATSGGGARSPRNEPLAIRRVASPPYDSQASPAQLLTEAKLDYQPPKAGGPPALWINRQAYVLLHDLLALPLKMRDAVTLLPEHITALDDELTARLQEPGGGGKGKLAEIQRLIRRAGYRDGEPRPVIVVQAGPEMTHERIQAGYREELDHVRGLQLTGGKLSGLIPYDELRAAVPEEVHTAEQALIANGYPDHPDYFAHEIFVDLLEHGDPALLNLNPQQARKMAVAYAKLLARSHGDTADEIIDEIAETHGFNRTEVTSALGPDRQPAAPHTGGPGEVSGTGAPSDRGGPSGGPGLERRSRPPLSGQPGAEPQRNTERGAVPAAALTAPTGAVARAAGNFYQQDVFPFAERFVEGMAGAWDDVRKILAPSSRGPYARLGANTVREVLAERQQRRDRAEAKMAGLKAHFYQGAPEMGVYGLHVIDAIEGSPERAAGLAGEDGRFVSTMRDLFGPREKEIRDLGLLKHFLENYFPHMWADPAAAGKFIAAWQAKRPLAGRESYRKQRSIPTVRDGLAAGLQPAFDNPVDFVLAKLVEEDKSITAHQAKGELQERHALEFVRMFADPPEGYAQIDDKIFTVYGPPTVTVNEAFDKQLRGRLENLAASLGIRHTRKVAIGGKSQGYTVKGSDEIVTRFGSPDSVIAHEIGHQLEFKYNLNNLLKAREYPERARELRALADLRIEGEGEVPASYQSYIHNKDEKMANAVAALIYAPEAFKEAAPNTWDYLRDELWHIPALRPIFDMPVRPTMTLGTAHAEVPVGGLVTVGHWYAPEPLARILNNHLSPGVSQSSLYQALATVNRTGNMIQLGLSFFHGMTTALNSSLSDMALGFKRVSQGKPIGGALAAARGLVPFASVVRDFLKGTTLEKVWDGKMEAPDETTAALVDALKAGGGRAHQDQFWTTSYSQQLVDALRKHNPLGAAWRLPFAALEQTIKPIMAYVVPRAKLGAFASAALAEMERMPGSGDALEDYDAARDRFGRIWDSMDNRFGQLNQANMFMHALARNLMNLIVGRPGWNLGTMREIGGGFYDLARNAIDLGRRKPTQLSDRTAYTLALFLGGATINALVQFALTGKPPSEPMDFIAPKDGGTDEEGRPTRIILPLYLSKDIYNYATRPLGTLSAKAAPAVQLATDLVRNRDWQGRKIYGEGGQGIGRYLVGNQAPYSVKGFAQNTERGESLARKVLPLVGVMPAGKRMGMTPAERMMAEYYDEQQPNTHRAETERSVAKRAILQALRRGEESKAAELTEQALQRGTITEDDFNRTLEGSATSRLEADYKRLPLLRDGKSWALDVYRAARADQKQTLLPLLLDKVNNGLDKLPANDQERIEAELAKLVR